MWDLLVWFSKWTYAKLETKNFDLQCCVTMCKITHRLSLCAEWNPHLEKKQTNYVVTNEEKKRNKNEKKAQHEVCPRPSKQLTKRRANQMLVPTCFQQKSSKFFGNRDSNFSTTIHVNALDFETISSFSARSHRCSIVFPQFFHSQNIVYCFGELSKSFH